MIQFLEINKLKVKSPIGFFEEERKLKSDFYVTVKMQLQIENEFDKLENTIDYGAVVALIKNELKIPRKLIESACNDIYTSIKSNYDIINHLEVTIYKKTVPLANSIIDSTSFTMTDF